MHVILDELITYLREPKASVDAEAAEQVLHQANELVDAVAGLAPSQPDPAGVTAIRLEVAARAYRNPNGYAGGRLGDYAAPTLPGGRSGVYLTDQERADLLGRPAGQVTGWAGSAPYAGVRRS